MKFLSTHLHCDLFEDFYDKTLLCCVTICSLMSSCALFCGLCYYVFANESKEEDYCIKG